MFIITTKIINLLCTPIFWTNDRLVFPAVALKFWSRKRLCSFCTPILSYQGRHSDLGIPVFWVLVPVPQCNSLVTWDTQTKNTDPVSDKKTGESEVI